jgi:hypothetical protein
MKLILLLLCASAFAQDWKQPAYWGLKRNEYIPGPGCFAGNWPGSHHKLDFEICARITYL